MNVVAQKTLNKFSKETYKMITTHGIMDEWFVTVASEPNRYIPITVVFGKWDINDMALSPSIFSGNEKGYVLNEPYKYYLNNKFERVDLEVSKELPNISILNTTFLRRIINGKIDRTKQVVEPAKYSTYQDVILFYTLNLKV